MAMVGEITRLFEQRRFGFLRGQDGIERFFHQSSLAAWAEYDALRLGDRVSFEIVASDRGPRADHVRRV